MDDTEKYYLVSYSSEWWNVFVCPSCGYTESLPANEQRHHMDIELLEYGETDEQYGLYKCKCGTEAWSFCEPWTPDECGD